MAEVIGPCCRTGKRRSYTGGLGRSAVGSGRGYVDFHPSNGTVTFITPVPENPAQFTLRAPHRAARASGLG